MRVEGIYEDAPVTVDSNAQISENELMMSNAFHNGLWNALGSVFNMSCGLIGSLMVVRSLTATNYGTLSYYVWLSSVLSVLGLLAFPHSHTKIVSELRGQGRFTVADQISMWSTRTVLFLNVGMSLFLVLCSFLITAEARPFVLIVATLLLPSSMATMLGSRLSALGRYSWSSIGVQVSSFVQLCIIVIGYTQHASVSYYLYALLSPAVYQIGFLIFGLRNSIRVYRGVFRKVDSEALHRYLTFFRPMTCVVLYERIVWDRSEILFLRIFSTMAQIGVYNLSYTVFGMFLNLGLALINGYWPAISSDYGAGKMDNIRPKISSAVLLSFVYTIPLTFGGLVTLPKIMLLMYGTKMASSGPVAIVLLCGLIPGVVNGVFSLTLSACGHVWTNVRVGLVTSLLSVILDVIFVPHFGALGGAFSCTLAQGINCIVLMVFVRRRFQVQFPWKGIIRLVLLGLVTTTGLPVIASLISPSVVLLVLFIALAGCLYVICVYKFGYFKLLKG